MIALIPIGAALVALLAYVGYSRWRDWSVHKRPFPDSWLEVLQARLPVYDALPPEQQSRLQDMVKFFIDRKKYYGCGGLTITDEMRVIVAAEACLLVLNRGGALYPKLKSILVYPTAFRVDREEHQADGTVAAGGHLLRWQHRKDGSDHHGDDQAFALNGDFNNANWSASLGGPAWARRRSCSISASDALNETERGAGGFGSTG